MRDLRLVLKRSFDLLFSFIGLLILSIPLLFIILAIIVVYKEHGLFKQTRVGMNAKTFEIYKLKTMLTDFSNTSTITTENDSRITKLGAFLRKYKIDELPQLWNIFIGDMSFVGPRPDVPGYADKLNGNDRIILDVRPGITGPAQLYFVNEETLLKSKKNPIEFNDTFIWPHKVKINVKYVKNMSLLQDLIYIIKTLF